MSKISKSDFIAMIVLAICIIGIASCMSIRIYSDEAYQEAWDKSGHCGIIVEKEITGVFRTAYMIYINFGYHETYGVEVTLETYNAYEIDDWFCEKDK